MSTDLHMTVTALLHPRERACVDEALRRADADSVARRVRDCDATLWGAEGTPEIGDRLGWITVAPRMLGDIDDLASFAEELARDRVSDVVLLGMGGSSLAPEVFRRTFQEQRAGLPAGGRRLPREDHAPPRLTVLDSTNAGAIRALEDAIDPQRTLFVVSSKSGGTIEPRCMLEHFWSVVPHGARFAAITDPGSGLEALARQRGFRRVFHGDPEIGGRYSALSAFGIVPAALIGVDVAALLRGAADAWDTPIAAHRAAQASDTTVAAHDTEASDTTIATRGAERTPAWLWLGTALGALAQHGRDKLSFHVSPTLDGLGLWLEQLLAESTGKQGTGILPIAQEPLLHPDAYGEDRVFVHIADTRVQDQQSAKRLRALAQAGHPTITIPTAGPADLGRIFMLAELTVAVAGWQLRVNPFDQPNVQEAKDATSAVLRQIEDGHAPQTPADATAQQLIQLLGSAAPPCYVALMGYAQPSQDFDAAVAQLRETLMRRRRVATTFGYGPRFLHSTGQFHKGGPPVGRFLQLLHDSQPDLAIPQKAYSFTTLEHAQADGDLQTLRSHQLPAERVTLSGADPAAALRALTAQIDTLLGGGDPEIRSAGSDPEIRSAGGDPEIRSAGGDPEIRSAGGSSA
ncbi:MAG: glucose-6-phosphate isomerase [Solirubrobacteraceae bacterium]